MPAIEYSLKFHPQLKINLVCHDYFVPLAQKVFSKYGERINIVGLSDAKEGTNYDETLQARSPYAHKISNLSWHITDHAFATLVGRDVENEHKNYLQMEPIDVSNFNLPSKYVVVTTGYTSKTRIWNKKSIEETCDYIVSKGYTPVYLGKSFTEAYNGNGITGTFDGDYSRGISLLDKTSIFEAHAIIANSKCIVGVDNGLCPHLAGMTSVPIVVGFTSVLEEHRLPYRENVRGFNCYPVTISKKELGCIGCQSNFNFASPDFSFTECAYKDFLCVEILTSDKFIKQLEKIL